MIVRVNHNAKDQVFIFAQENPTLKIKRSKPIINDTPIWRLGSITMGGVGTPLSVFGRESSIIHQISLHNMEWS